METKQRERAKRDDEEIDEVKAAEPKEFDIDDLLDEIDDVLEENAEEFVGQYIQKGGE